MIDRDPDEMNEQRAAWASAAIDLFSRATGADTEEESLCDLITDLLHWAERHDIDWQKTLAASISRYFDETGINIGYDSFLKSSTPPAVNPRHHEAPHLSHSCPLRPLFHDDPRRR